MDEDIAIVNQETRVTLIKNFFKNNFKKILIIIITVLIILISFFSIEEIKKRKKNKLAEAYNTIIFNSDKFSELEIKEKMIKIVHSKVNTYSALALYYLIDNNKLNESDKKKIRKLIKKFSIKDIVQVINENNNISKKAIYDFCLTVKNEK